jgi:5-methyltetrahydrofolate--homocysteine methyltransferase
MDLLSRIAARLQEGDEEDVAALTEQAIAGGLPARQILDEGLIQGMNVVGERFRNHEIFLPEVLLAARAMYAGMDRVKPLLLRDQVPTLGRVVIGTVQGDLHDIGKNLVGIMLRGAGFEVIDLGNDVAPDRFVETARESGARVVGLSALLTTTMPVMQTVVERLAAAGLREQVRVVIGGAPVSQEFAERIGADAYAYDAANAVERVRALAAS